MDALKAPSGWPLDNVRATVGSALMHFIDKTAQLTLGQRAITNLFTLLSRMRPRETTSCCDTLEDMELATFTI